MIWRYNRLVWFGFGVAILFFGLQTNLASAAFGISPPFVNSDHLLPGSRYVQTVFLVQDHPDQDTRIKAELEINDRIKSWITINNGDEIIIPKGVRQFPVNVEIRIPKSAELGLYKGSVTFVGVPDVAGQVTVALGVKLLLNLTVGTGIYREYSIPLVRFLDIEEGWSPRVYVKFYNGGNVPESLEQAVYELSDQFGAVRLAFIQKNDGFEEIPPFTTQDLTIEFPIDLHLGVGQYWGSVNLYKEGKILAHQRAVFNVLEKGSLSNPFKLALKNIEGNWIYYSIAALVLAVGFFVFKRKKFKFFAG